MSYLFTSESVSEGHPDKICDQLSDAILDAILDQDPAARVACDCTVTTGLVLVTGEITTEAYIEIPDIVRNTLKGIGYDNASYGIDWETCMTMNRTWGFKSYDQDWKSTKTLVQNLDVQHAVQAGASFFDHRIVSGGKDHRPERRGPVGLGFLGFCQ